MGNLRPNNAHWAAFAFALPGKKVLDAAEANAKNKASIADVLDVIAKST